MIEVRPELVPVSTQAETALLCDSRAGIYVRGRALVRVGRDAGAPREGVLRPAGAPVIEPLTPDALRHRLDRAARWVRPGRKGPRPVLPPEWVVRDIMARASWKFPTLTAVVETPTLTPGGDVLALPGYDERTGLLFVPVGDFPAVPNEPTAVETRDAVKLLAEPLADFPFVAACDRAAAVAAALTLVARHAVEGPVPMFATRATTPGSGKTLLYDVVSLIGTGRVAARMAMPDGDDELRKAVLSVALDGTSAVLLDNVDSALGSHTLAAALTAEHWTGRLLGRSQMARVPLRAVWLATGNGLTFKGDLGRRVVPVDLDPRCEHPEDRTDFRHPDLLRWVREHRPALVVAALTVLRAYHLAGRPAHARGPRAGSFERWDDLIRGALVWAGFGDPLGGRERVRAEADDDVLSLRVALGVWGDAFGSRPLTIAEVVVKANGRAERGDLDLRDALLGLTPGRDKLDPRALGVALRRLRGRIVGTAWFDRAGERHNTTLWAVKAETDGDRGDMTDMGDLFPPFAGVRDGECAGRTAGNISPVAPISPALDRDRAEMHDG